MKDDCNCRAGAMAIDPEDPDVRVCIRCGQRWRFTVQKSSTHYVPSIWRKVDDDKRPADGADCR